MYKLNKKGFSFVELILSLAFIGMFMVFFITINGLLLRVCHNNKNVTKNNNIIEITYYELKFNSFFLKDATESQVVYLDKKDYNSLIHEDIDKLFVNNTEATDFFLINIDCDYDKFVNKIKVEFYNESELKWEKILYVSKSQV